MNDKKKSLCKSCNWNEGNPERECNVEENNEAVRGRQRCSNQTTLGKNQ